MSANAPKRGNVSDCIKPISLAHMLLAQRSELMWWTNKVLACHNLFHATTQPPRACSPLRCPRSAARLPRCTRPSPTATLGAGGAGGRARRTARTASGHATAATRASATAAPSTTPPTASTRTRSCATSTGARRRGCRAAGSLREWELVALDREIEVAPGVRFAAWTYNGRIPGPTLRCREGERLRITFANGSAHPHTIHFHGIHPAEMDGVPGLGAGRDPARRQDRLRVRRAAGRAAPLPLPRPPARRAHRQGPLRRVHRRPGRRPRGRRRARDGDERVRHELRPRQRGLRREHDRLRVHGHGRSWPARDELVRVYLVNVLEYDLINSFHLHGNLFHYFPTGTSRSRRPSSPTR